MLSPLRARQNGAPSEEGDARNALDSIVEWHESYLTPQLIRSGSLWEPCPPVSVEMLVHGGTFDLTEDRFPTVHTSGQKCNKNVTGKIGFLS
jgi:hypothetical protein